MRGALLAAFLVSLAGTAAALPVVTVQDAPLAGAGDAVPGIQQDVTAKVPAPVDLPDVQLTAAGTTVAVVAGPESSSGTATVRSSVSVRPVPGTVAESASFSLFALLLAAQAAGADALRPLWRGPSTRVSAWLRGLPFMAPLFSLFSRLDESDLLGHATRGRIQQAVAEQPGMSMQQLRGVAGVAWGTTVYHLRRLESAGLVVSVRQAGSRRYFPANTEASRHRTAIAALSHGTARRIARFVSAHPGVHQAALCAALGLRNPAASKHLQRMAGLGMVAVAPQGPHRTYAPTDALHAALRLVGPEPVQLVERPAAPLAVASAA